MKNFISPVLLMACASGSVLASSFNPDISLTLDGRYTDYNNDTDYALPGFMLGGEAEREAQGLSLGHSEIVLSANIDDMLYGKLTTAIAEHEGETELELEEAYIETIALGQGFSLRAGRFFSDIGYLNNQHPHAWDFADAPLIYRGLFANQLIDDGLQINWLAPSETYIRLGLEILRGDRFPAGGSDEDGQAASTAFIKVGGDIGSSHAWQLGLSYWKADISERLSLTHEHDAATETPAYQGESSLTGIDFIYKWAPNGNSQEQNFKLQLEYFSRDEDGDIELVGSDPLESSSYKGKQKGWYIQSVYQFMPRWRAGLRYDQIEADNSGSDLDALDEAGLLSNGHSPSRSTLMFDYSHSEYSRFRLQIAQDESYSDTDRVIQLQYIVTMGAHGAHRF